jgi:ferredoxin
MRVHVDWTRCDGHGACAELLPELLTTDDWGFPLVRGDQRDPGVPAALEKLARRAVKACPLQALRTVD